MQTTRLTSLFTTLSLFSCLALVSPAMGAPASCAKRLNEVADFKQNNPHANFEEGGKDFCAPTSLSDYLMWLGHHGYPNLLPAAENQEAVQIALIKKLASSAYMGTDPNTGTSPGQIMVGLKKYISDCGYEVSSLTYQGFRPSAKEFNTGVSTPDLNWLQAGSLSPKCCWLNVGWYKYDESTDIYTRTGGHWMALVGYGVNAKSEPSPYTIIVHDPQPRFGTDKVNVYINLQKLDSGKLTGNFKGLPHDAEGFYWYESYTNGTQTKEMKNNYGIIDGGIVLEMAKSAAPATKTTD